MIGCCSLFVMNNSILTLTPGTHISNIGTDKQSANFGCPKSNFCNRLDSKRSLTRIIYVIVCPGFGLGIMDYSTRFVGKPEGGGSAMYF